MATDNMMVLKNKLIELNRMRDSLKREVEADKGDVLNLESTVKTLEFEYENTGKGNEVKREKKLRFDEIVKSAEEVVKRLTESATKLDDVLKSELEIVKGVVNQPKATATTPAPDAKKLTSSQ